MSKPITLVFMSNSSLFRFLMWRVFDTGGKEESISSCWVCNILGMQQVKQDGWGAEGID